jgi:hypothetical protein
MKTREYSNATLCQNFKAIGEELSEIEPVQTNIYIFIYIDYCQGHSSTSLCGIGCIFSVLASPHHMNRMYSRKVLWSGNWKMLQMAEWSWGSSISVVTVFALDGQDLNPGRAKIFLFSTLSIPALGPTQPHIQWVPGAGFLGVKQPGREADHSLSPPSNAEIKNSGAIPLLSRMSSWHSVWSIKHRDNFTCIFTNDRIFFLPLIKKRAQLVYYVIRIVSVL